MKLDEAIKWLKIEASYIEADVGNGKEILEAYDMAIKALKQQPCVLNTKDLSDDEMKKFVEEMKNVRAQVIPKELRWIPCSERLPEDEQDVLISLTWDNGVCEVRQGDRDSIDYWKHFNHIIFIAWMHLPEPYVPDNNDGKMEEGDKH